VADSYEGVAWMAVEYSRRLYTFRLL